MSWQDEYRRKLTTADDALSVLRSSQRVWVQQGNSTPQPLIDAMIRRAPVLKDVEVISMLTLGDAPYTRPEFAGTFRHGGLFLGANVREAVQAGRADYTPIFLSEIEGLFLVGRDAARCRADAGGAAGRARLPEHGHLRGLHADGRAHRHGGDRRSQRPHAAHLWRLRSASSARSTPWWRHRARCWNCRTSHVPTNRTFGSPQRGLADARRRDAATGHRRHSGRGAALPGQPSRPGLAQRDVLRRHHPADRERRHQWRRARPCIRGKLVLGFVLGTQRLFDFLHENHVFRIPPHFAIPTIRS